MSPGRVRAGVGLGNTHWLRQMGLLPQRPLTETFDADLLAGASSIGLWLFPPDRLHHQLHQLAGEVLPTLG